MSGFDWFLIGWWILGAVVTTAQVGQERKPLTPGVAAWVLIIHAALIAALVIART